MTAPQHIIANLASKYMHFFRQSLHFVERAYLTDKDNLGWIANYGLQIKVHLTQNEFLIFLCENLNFMPFYVH